MNRHKIIIKSLLCASLTVPLDIQAQVRGAAVGGGAYLVETFIAFASPPLLLWENKTSTD